MNHYVDGYNINFKKCPETGMTKVKIVDMYDTSAIIMSIPEKDLLVLLEKFKYYYQECYE